MEVQGLNDSERNEYLRKQALLQLDEEKRVQKSAAWRLQIGTVKSIISSGN